MEGRPLQMSQLYNVIPVHCVALVLLKYEDLHSNSFKLHNINTSCFFNFY